MPWGKSKSSNAFLYLKSNLSKAHDLIKDQIMIHLIHLKNIEHLKAFINEFMKDTTERICNVNKC